MAEAALGVAASVISIASFAIQLADSVQKACDFWESVQDGPEEIGRISLELRLLSNILRSISHEHKEQTQGRASRAQDTNRVQDSLVMEALNIAKRDINNLDIIVTQLSSMIGPGHGRTKRKWGQVKFALKSGKINKMKMCIESAKSTLTLLQSSRAQAAMYQMNGRIEIISANMLSTSTTIERQPATTLQEEQFSDNCYSEAQCLKEDLQLESSSPSVATQGDLRYSSTSGLQIRTKTTWTSINAGLARLSIQSLSTALNDPDAEEDQNSNVVSNPTRTTFTVNLLWGFSSCRRGFRISISSPFDFMKLNSIRRRPNDSLLFNLCIFGDTRRVHKLFLKGEASVFDADEDGRGLLHYACRHGRSDLAKFLLSNGADCYQRSDLGKTAVDELEDYDRECLAAAEVGDGEDDWEDYERNDEIGADAINKCYADDKDYTRDDVNARRKDIAKIVDTLVRDTPFDPFDYPDYTGNETLILFRGLPHENLKYLLSQESQLIATKDCFQFIVENLIFLDDTVDDFQNCVDLLLTKYETMQQNPVTCNEWPYKVTLLQTLLDNWLFQGVVGEIGAKAKISRCLTLTEDLYEVESAGTPLDFIAGYDSEKVESWLKLLAKNEIDVSEYLAYEFDQHPDGIVYQSHQCCRNISFHFQRGEIGFTGVEVENVCDPQYDHFHPEYRCEVGISRERCIIMFPDIMVDEDGRPSHNIPGSWEGSLKPNSELFLVRGDWAGRQYVDFLKQYDYVWDEANGKWKYVP
ncbi:uncharacterized protein PAC_04729 [Phialocephala subalpina]|uniref:Uncharacterized protein n=1 Tax=Phialocephala subalpina TaxID=576137 RepID=A0A1L7WPZ5_9HELO|nr:uncharacterized protein PAC_04729 [Phialocephala subalpina]